MKLYEVQYVVKRRGKEFSFVYTTEAGSEKEAIRKTIEYTKDHRYPHPFRPKARIVKQ